MDALNVHADISAAPRGVINADFRFDNLVLGMPVEPGSTTVAFREQGHAPQLKVDDSGRVSRTPRAWGIVARGHRRQGVGWVECNRQSPNL